MNSPNTDNISSVDDAIVCTICYELIGEVNEEQDGVAEALVETSCGHIFGDLCLQRWRLCSNSCPECRTELTELGTGYFSYPILSSQPTIIEDPMAEGSSNSNPAASSSDTPVRSFRTVRDVEAELKECVWDRHWFRQTRRLRLRRARTAVCAVQGLSSRQQPRPHFIRWTYPPAPRQCIYARPGGVRDLEL